MKKCKTPMLYLMLIIFIQLTPQVLAGSNVTVNNVSGEVIISGKSQQVSQHITILVLTPDADIGDLSSSLTSNVIHTASIKSDLRGNFKHRFKLSNKIEGDEYIIYINDGNEVEQLFLEYNPTPYPYMDFPIGNNDVFAEVSNFAKEVVISGSADSGAVATVLVYNPSGDLHFASSQTVKSGKFYFDFEMDYANQSGDYQVFVSVPKAKTKAMLTYSFANALKIKEVIDAVNSSTSSDQLLLILNNAENENVFVSLGCFVDNLAMLSDDAKKAFAKVLFRDGADYSFANDYAEFTEHFNQALLIAVVNSEKDTDKLLDFLKDKADLIGIDFSQTSQFAKAGTELQRKIITEFANAGDYKYFADIRDSFYLKSFLNILNESSYTAVDSLVRYYGEILDINLTAYDRLSQSQKFDVARELTKSTYSTLSGFQENLNLAVGNIKSGSPSSSSGGGLSGGGGPSYAPILVPDVSQVPIAETESYKVFKDIDVVPWAKEGILSLYKKGIITGDGKGNFNPQDNIKREEFVKLIVLAFDIPQKDGEVSFADVAENDWYYEYVKTATIHGIIQGYDNAFGVGNYITREDIAVILHRISKENIELNTAKFADDDSISDYAGEAVYYLKQKGIISGTSDNYYLPKDFATRAEVSKILYGMLD